MVVIIKIILAILIFSFIIIFHELGHFLFAKKCDVKVNEFTLGLGPTLVSWGKGETKYCIKLLPFGGSCVMEGEDEESDSDRAFSSKSLWQRFQIVFGGPLFNFILAYILSVVYIASIGVNDTTITDVIVGYAADEAGMQAGDEIISLGGYRVHFYSEISLYTFLHSEDESIDVVYERDGQRHKATIIPKYSEESGRKLIGITKTNEFVKVSPLRVLEYAAYEIKSQIYMTISSIKLLFVGQISVNDVSGPVGVVSAISTVYDESVTSGIFYVFINLTSIAILLSANLGVMNLIPFPALDGGRIFLIIIEAIRGKKMKPEIENGINLVGFALLMLLMIVVMYNDILKLI
ncbi:regulator of sigma E protease [Pseudobutyrivibrio sp. YE44]|uniref:M50 family metallopeptidase n=1 Tax=Pseudobutyrivibrio sp. YE44 TaxID=1520802 RepID=UPI00089089E5|nr:M50 family metallopeptidase [Pseudobutyrivibrio sp. YE44]SDB10796.1 regulator of sigma E protease [Pseudobutyrivibrio sp. YE44]